MGLFDKLKRGMHVYGTDDRSVGTIDRWDNDNVYVGGKSYPRSSFDRFDNDRLYFSQEGYRQYQGSAQTGRTGAMGDMGRAGAMGEEDIRVPVMEERISVDKRQAERGSVDIKKDVVTEQVNVPVELRREEVSVNRVDVPDRRVGAGEIGDAFEEGTIRVPIRGEEAVARKETFVTGEVVIDRDVVTERETISDTIRKERVDVDENYERNREGFRQHFEGRRAGLTGSTADTRTFEDAETNYRTGYTAANDKRFAGRKFEDAEPEIRRSHGSMGSGDSWEHLREEIREGWERARRR
jgi:uncharacterized protein (TIGR02271 family)